jgi:hypothetical protein
VEDDLKRKSQIYRLTNKDYIDLDAWYKSPINIENWYLYLHARCKGEEAFCERLQSSLGAMFEERLFFYWSEIGREFCEYVFVDCDRRRSLRLLKKWLEKGEKRLSDSGQLPVADSYTSVK